MKDIKETTARAHDHIQAAKRSQRMIYTEFLNPAQQSMYMDILRKEPGVRYMADGGHILCERRVLAIHDDLPYEPDFESVIAYVRVQFDDYSLRYLNHRSVLGAVLGCGIDRKVIGDILISDNSAYIIVLSRMTSYVCEHLLTVGRAHVHTTVWNDSIDIVYSEGECIRSTVASLRVDNLIALGLRISRGKAQELIQSERVFRNWHQVMKPSVELVEGDVLSIRKMGRLVIRSIGNRSQKGRIWVEIDRWMTS